MTTFLDILPAFIMAYKRDLNEWLYTLLTRLLVRMGGPDLLDSVYKKLKACLAMVNRSFDVHAQFTVLIRFINDNSSAPGVKAKEILLRYLQQILQHLEPVDMANNADIRIALSKIMNWANEPKSTDVRKVRINNGRSNSEKSILCVGVTSSDSSIKQSQSTRVQSDARRLATRVSSKSIGQKSMGSEECISAKLSSLLSGCCDKDYSIGW